MLLCTRFCNLYCNAFVVEVQDHQLMVTGEVDQQELLMIHILSASWSVPFSLLTLITSSPLE